jgi:hypothetical protein
MERIQNEDGSFDTMYLQPYYNPTKGWMKYAGNSPFDTSISLIPLIFMDSSKGKGIIKKGIQFLLRENLDNLLWSYPYLNEETIVPYDSDGTSMSSFVLTKSGYKIRNKEFLNSLINEHNNYPSYIWVNKFSKHLPIFTSLKMKWRNWKTKNSINVNKDLMRLTDWEFSCTCVNLLYLGKMPENEKVWKETQRAFEAHDIGFLYYINLFRAFYFYTRLAGYGNHGELIDNKSFIDKYIAELHGLLVSRNNFESRMLFTISLLFCNHNLIEYLNLFEKNFSDIEAGIYTNIFPLYSSNKKTDFQPNTHEPNTYFGSQAITCSLYIEFLNLYRKRFYGSYYGQD